MAIAAHHMRFLQRWDFFWIAFAVVLGIGLWLAAYLVDHARLDPDEAFSALSEHPFSQPLPLDLTLDSQNSRSGAEAEGVVGFITFADNRKTEGAQGGVAVISYQVHTSAAKAESAFNEYWRDFGNDDEKVFTLDGIRKDHLCEEYGGAAYCQAVIGPIYMEANSRIPWFLDGQGFQLDSLMKAAVKHFDAVTAGL
jgi:hypothetical protein